MSKTITLKLDLYEYTQIEKVCKLAAEKLGLRKEELEADLQALTGLLEYYRDKKIHQANANPNSYRDKIQVPTAAASKCIGFLKSGNLVEKFNELIGKSGIVGEETNRILLFIIASSYKMPDTLHALIQGSSGSGKTRLLKISGELMPP